TFIPPGFLQVAVSFDAYVLLISRREGKQRKQKIYKAKYGTKKDLMQHSKVLHKVSIFRFSWEFSGY
ncbi:MAG: hypothetical protein ACI4TK_19120, partial [Agathobacter sp.]